MGVKDRTMADMETVSVLDRPLYSIGEGACLLEIQASKLRRWLEGAHVGGRAYSPVIRPYLTGSSDVTWADHAARKKPVAQCLPQDAELPACPLSLAPRAQRRERLGPAGRGGKVCHPWSDLLGGPEFESPGVRVKSAWLALLVAAWLEGPV